MKLQNTTHIRALFFLFALFAVSSCANNPFSFDSWVENLFNIVQVNEADFDQNWNVFGCGDMDAIELENRGGNKTFNDRTSNYGCFVEAVKAGYPYFGTYIKNPNSQTSLGCFGFRRLPMFPGGNFQNCSSIGLKNCQTNLKLCAGTNQNFVFIGIVPQFVTSSSLTQRIQSAIDSSTFTRYKLYSGSTISGGNVVTNFSATSYPNCFNGCRERVQAGKFARWNNNTCTCYASLSSGSVVSSVSATSYVAHFYNQMAIQSSKIGRSYYNASGAAITDGLLDDSAQWGYCTDAKLNPIKLTPSKLVSKVIATVPLSKFNLGVSYSFNCPNNTCDWSFTYSQSETTGFETSEGIEVTLSIEADIEVASMTASNSYSATQTRSTSSTVQRDQVISGTLTNQRVIVSNRLELVVIRTSQDYFFEGAAAVCGVSASEGNIVDIAELFDEQDRTYTRVREDSYLVNTLETLVVDALLPSI